MGTVDPNSDSSRLGPGKFGFSRLSLGTVSLGMDYGISTPDQHGKPPRESALELLEKAAAAGVTVFDTAPAYGSSEELLGEAFHDRPEIKIATKIGAPEPAAIPVKDWVADSLDRSRRRLRRDRLDIVQLHSVSFELLREGSITDALVEARANGTIARLGASVYSEQEALFALASGKFEVVQIAFNVLDQRMAARFLPAANRKGTAVLTRSAHLKGCLTPKAQFLPEPLARLREAVDRLRSELGLAWEELPEFALRYCLSIPEITSVLIGPRTVEELNTALAAAYAGPLPESVLNRMTDFALDDDALLNPSRWPID